MTEVTAAWGAFGEKQNPDDYPAGAFIKEARLKCNDPLLGRHYDLTEEEFEELVSQHDYDEEDDFYDDN